MVEPRECHASRYQKGYELAATCQKYSTFALTRRVLPLSPALALGPVSALLLPVRITYATRLHSLHLVTSHHNKLLKEPLPLRYSQLIQIFKEDSQPQQVCHRSLIDEDKNESNNDRVRLDQQAAYPLVKLAIEAIEPCRLAVRNLHTEACTIFDSSSPSKSGRNYQDVLTLVIAETSGANIDVPHLAGDFK